MAENKKAVLLYCDIIHTVEKLTDVEAGKLFKHYLRYINDLNPVSDSLTEIVFEPIKQSLKRDLKKYNNKLSSKSDAGKKSAGKREFEKWLKENTPNIYNISKDLHLFEVSKCTKSRNESYNNGFTTDWFFYNYCIEFHQQQSTNPTPVESVEIIPTNPTDSDKDKGSVIDKDILINNNVPKNQKNDFKTLVLNFNSEVKDFYKEIKNEFPKHLQPNTNKTLYNWLDTIEKLNRIDKIPFSEIKKIVKGIRNSDFWSKNFLSLTKLRKKNKDGIKYIVVFSEYLKSKDQPKEKEIKIGRQTLETIKQNAQGW